MIVGLLYILILSNTCTSRPIQLTCGICETAQIGINHFQPLVDALEKYRVDNLRYPSDLRELVPKYIDKISIILGKEVPPEVGNEPIYNVLRHEKLGNKLSYQDDQGRVFSLGFLTQDDRICLLGGRNNICEYSSDRPFWNCHQ
jgi:hypothetical protein